MANLASRFYVFANDRERDKSKCQSPILMKFGINFHQKYLTRIIFLLAIVDLEGMKTKTNLKLGDAERILSNISAIIKDTVFCVH